MTVPLTGATVVVLAKVMPSGLSSYPVEAERVTLPVRLMPVRAYVFVVEGVPMVVENPVKLVGVAVKKGVLSARTVPVTGTVAVAPPPAKVSVVE